ncbi:TIGR02587 family membrane protein [Rhizobium sp. RU36D]|uniref:TIGR02587 family membrane protein n=1 Tax=Rhizobium sp. RU36D TaxID=1907415 RepID=UPI000A0489B8|nr:TIGR02587 family membrane protein [Rhizobium sp. RU36D]
MAAQSGDSFDDARRVRRNRFLMGLARGIAGALLFALPMLMTMEMWFLGFYMGRDRLLLLMLLNIPLLVVLAHRIGFERTVSWREAARDATVAYGIGIVSSALILTVFGLLKGDMPGTEIIGKIALQSVPASIGAMLGRSQLAGDADDDEDEEEPDETQTTYFGELFLMAVGALILSLNVAPTEEMIVIAYKMTHWHALALVILSIALMHGFVYAVSFEGGHELSPDTPWWHAFVRFTLPGFVIALSISLYTLWSFERIDDTSAANVLLSVIVLAFPASLGAAAARLIL